MILIVPEHDQRRWRTGVNCWTDIFISWWQVLIPQYDGNKTASHHRHIFRRLSLLKIPFRRMEDVFFRENYYVNDIISLDTHSTANLPPLPISKNSSLFSKIKLRTYLTNLSISVVFHGKLAIIWWWKFSSSEPSDIRHFQLASKHKKRSRWVDDFPSIFKYGQKVLIYSQSHPISLCRPTNNFIIS